MELTLARSGRWTRIGGSGPAGLFQWRPAGGWLAKNGFRNTIANSSCECMTSFFRSKNSSFLLPIFALSTCSFFKQVTSSTSGSIAFNSALIFAMIRFLAVLSRSRFAMLCSVGPNSQ